MQQIQALEGEGVVVGGEAGAAVPAAATVAVRLGEGESALTLCGLPCELLRPREWEVFISHAQLEAQNQCGARAYLASKHTSDGGARTPRNS
eukprot:COSAG01_NODE_42618_length_438_cov_0.778761_2_plen_91_part_01